MGLVDGEEVDPHALEQIGEVVPGLAGQPLRRNVEQAVAAGQKIATHLLALGELE